MPFRFRKSVKILPGVKVNLSKGGVSTSVGGKGFHVNVGKRGVRKTIGIPGTGISHTSNVTSSPAKSQGCCLVSLLTIPLRILRR